MSELVISLRLNASSTKTNQQREDKPAPSNVSCLSLSLSVWYTPNSFPIVPSLPFLWLLMGICDKRNRQRKGAHGRLSWLLKLKQFPWWQISKEPECLWPSTVNSSSSDWGYRKEIILLPHSSRLPLFFLALHVWEAATFSLEFQGRRIDGSYK